MHGPLVRFAQALHAESVVEVVSVMEVVVEVVVVPQRVNASGQSYVLSVGFAHRSSIKSCLHAPDVPNLQPLHILYSGSVPFARGSGVVVVGM